MSKIALITDLHYGVRNDSAVFLDYFKKFNDIFFDRLSEGDITHVCILGDLVDKRKNINFLTANRLREDFLIPLKNTGIPTNIIPGNHDSFFKNTIKINALSELRLAEMGFNVIETPQTILIDGVPVLMLPWICPENYDDSMNAITKSSAEICFGHLELKGFNMYIGLKNADGMSPKHFDKFKYVASGHFHTRSNSKNIHYIGAAYEHRWSDFGDPRGFTILDTETMTTEFIENPFKMFHLTEYDDSSDTGRDFIKRRINGEMRDYSNSYVKVLMLSKDNSDLFDAFIDKIYETSPLEVTIVDRMIEYVSEDGEDLDEVATENTVTTLNKYVDGLETNLDLDRLKVTLNTIYIEATELEKSIVS